MKIPFLADEALDSEIVVLASMILDPALFPALEIAASDFSAQNHAVLGAMAGVFADTGSLDTVLIFEELRRRGQHWEGAAVYVSCLTDGVPRNVSLDGHLRRIRNVAIRRKLGRLCEETLNACYDLSSTPAELLDQHRVLVSAIDAEDVRGKSLGLVRGCDVTPEAIRWLIAPYLPHGQLSLLVGDPGLGKTYVSLAIAASITAGRPLFSVPAKPRNVIYLSNEDSPSILRGRFDLLGGNPDRIWFESPQRIISLGDHAALENEIQRQDVALVIFDTLTTHFGAKADFHKASEVAAVLSPLVAMAQRSGATVLGLMHLSKSSQTHSLYRVQGSTAFAGSARSIMAVGADPGDPDVRVLTHLKSNGAAEGPSRRFSIADSGIVWGEITELRAADVLRTEATSEDRSERSVAMDFLRDALSLGSRDAAEVLKEAEQQQISKRTLERAKAALGVKSRKTALKGGWIWWIGDQKTEERQDRQEGCQLAPSLQ